MLVDPAVLETLPSREYRAGLYESLKCGIIGDPGLFRLFEERRRGRAELRGLGVAASLVGQHGPARAQVVLDRDCETRRGLVLKGRRDGERLPGLARRIAL